MLLRSFLLRDKKGKIVRGYFSFRKTLESLNLVERKAIQKNISKKIAGSLYGTKLGADHIELFSPI